LLEGEMFHTSLFHTSQPPEAALSVRTIISALREVRYFFCSVSPAHNHPVKVERWIEDSKT
jgi:hypothetical protein